MRVQQSAGTETVHSPKFERYHQTRWKNKNVPCEKWTVRTLATSREHTVEYIVESVLQHSQTNRKAKSMSRTQSSCRPLVVHVFQRQVITSWQSNCFGNKSVPWAIRVGATNGRPKAEQTASESWRRLGRWELPVHEQSGKSARKNDPRPLSSCAGSASMILQCCVATLREISQSVMTKNRNRDKTTVKRELYTRGLRNRLSSVAKPRRQCTAFKKPYTLVIYHAPHTLREDTRCRISSSRDLLTLVTAQAWEPPECCRSALE